MAVVQTLIGNIKGPQGEQGATGAAGAPGSAATINVGSVTTTAYGNPAQVTNSGTESDAVFDFVIPQGKPGQATTTMGGLTLDSITTSTADFPSPQVGDTGATAFGKIVKFFADTIAALNTKLNTANVVNNLTTTASGYALDARQGKAISDLLTPIETKQSDLTVAQNVTINRFKCWSMLGFTWLYASITTSASFTSATDLISGLPHADSLTEFPTYIQGGTSTVINVRSGGTLRFGGTSSAGTYTFNGVYKILVS